MLLVVKGLSKLLIGLTPLVIKLFISRKWYLSLHCVRSRSVEGPHVATEERNKRWPKQNDQRVVTTERVQSTEHCRVVRCCGVEMGDEG